MDWRESRFTRHHNLLTGAAPITGPIVDNGRTAGKKVGRKVAGGIQYVGGAASLKPSTETTIPLTGLTGGLASSPAENDVAIHMSCWSANATVPVPSGWTAILTGLTQDATAGIRLSVLIAYKVLGAGETTIPAPSVRTEVYTVQVFRGVNTTTPLDVPAVSSLINDSPQPNLAAVTPVTSGAVVVGCGASHGAYNANVFTTPDLTNFLTYVNTPGSFDEVVGAGFIPWSGTGPVDPAQFGGGATSNPSWCSSGQATIALRPA